MLTRVGGITAGGKLTKAQKKMIKSTIRNATVEQSPEKKESEHI